LLSPSVIGINRQGSPTVDRYIFAVEQVLVCYIIQIAVGADCDVRHESPRQWVEATFADLRHRDSNGSLPCVNHERYSDIIGVAHQTLSPFDSLLEVRLNFLNLESDSSKALRFGKRIHDTPIHYRDASNLLREGRAFHFLDPLPRLFRIVQVDRYRQAI
jgi:hypothetical protein